MENIKITEQWKDIYGYEGIYQVSNLGRVKSLKCGKERILKSCVNGFGYHLVNLYLNKGYKSLYVHRLVATAFIDNPNNRREIDHINRDKNDNRACNLRWVTRKENMDNRTDDWVHEWKQNVIKAKSKAVRCIETGKIYSSATEAAKEIGVHRSSIYACALKKKGRKTTGGYHWEYVED